LYKKDNLVDFTRNAEIDYEQYCSFGKIRGWVSGRRETIVVVKEWHELIK
jgi:hypothetical protein